MHWTAGQLIGLLRHPFVSDCIPLYHRMILNYFNLLKLYLITSNHMLGLAPLLSVGFTETCPVYLLLTVTLWSMNLHYKFLAQAFLYYVGLTVFLIFFFYSSFVLMSWSVKCLSQGCSYSYTNFATVLRYLRPGLPELLLGYVGCWCLAVKQLLFSDCMVHQFFSHSPPFNHKHVIYRLIHCCL